MAVRRHASSIPNDETRNPNQIRMTNHEMADAFVIRVSSLISALKKMGHTDAEAHHFDTEGILWMEFPNLPAELGIRATERCVNRIINATGRRLD